jgi:hypothetical protein
VLVAIPVRDGGTFSPITTKAVGQPNFRALSGITIAAAVRAAGQEDGYRAANGEGFRPVSAERK